MAHIDHEKALQLWRDGLLDSQIAKELGCTKSSVWGWRQRNDLPTNKGLFDWRKEKRHGDYNAKRQAL